MKTYSRNSKSLCSIKEQSTIKYEDYCRLCLTKDSIMIHIFNEDEIVPIPLKLKYTTSLEVTEDDGLPCGICTDCISKLDESYAFKKRCLATDSKLRHVPFSSSFNSTTESFKVNTISESICDSRSKDACTFKLDDNGLLFLNDFCNTINKLNNTNNNNVPTNLDMSSINIGSDSLHPSFNVEANNDPININNNYCNDDEKNNTIQELEGDLFQCERNNPERTYTKKKRLNLWLPKAGVNDELTSKGKDVDHEFNNYFVDDGKTNTIEELQGELFNCDSNSERTYSKKKKLNLWMPKAGVNDELKSKEKDVDNELNDYCNGEGGDKTDNMIEMQGDVDNEHNDKSERKSTRKRKLRPWLLEAASLNDDELSSEEGVVNEELTALNDDSWAKKSPYKCVPCGIRFLTYTELISHKRTTHSDTIKMCNMCSKTFISNSTLERHMRIHTGDRPYRCDDCGKRFSQKVILRRHINIHANKRGGHFGCSDCKYTCGSAGSLGRHINSRHLSVDRRLPMSKRARNQLRTFKCRKCDKAFCHPSGLSRHQSVHTGVVFRCVSCGKSFSDKSSVKRHFINIHYEEDATKYHTVSSF